MLRILVLCQIVFGMLKTIMYSFLFFYNFKLTSHSSILCMGKFLPVFQIGTIENSSFSSMRPSEEPGKSH